MKKEFFVLVFLVLIMGQVFSADAISNYVVPDVVSLGLPITATGLFTADDGNKADFLCSFYIFDTDDGSLVKRATDQYSTTTGRFTMVGVVANEPLFKREHVYNVQAECGTATADSNFIVGQRETIAHVGEQEFDYLTTPENVDTIFIWIISGLLIVAFLGFFVFIIKYAGGK